jgi:uncharacterized iron-regulated membrane protein
MTPIADTHRAAGLWVCPATLVIAFTGLTLAVTGVLLWRRRTRRARREGQAGSRLG